MGRSELRIPLRILLREEPNQEQLARMWQTIDKEPKTRRLKLRPIWGLAVAAGLLLAVFYWQYSSTPSHQSDGPLRLANGQALTLSPKGITKLSDGSILTLRSESKLDVLANSAQVFAAALRHGHAEFSVEPGGSRVWRIESGALTIEVVGTVFSVERKEDQVEVVVNQGAVIVRGEGVQDRVRRVSAGQRLAVPEPDSLASKAAALPGSAPVPVVRPLVEESLATVGAGSASYSESTPIVSSQQAASTSLGRPGGTATKDAGVRARPTSDAESEDSHADLEGYSEAEADSIDEYLKKADALRLKGDHRAAANILASGVRMYPGDTLAGLAAVTLGRIYLDSLNDPRNATWAFQRALTIGGLPAAIEKATYERLVVALRRLGDTFQAHKVEREFRLRYPERESEQD